MSGEAGAIGGEDDDQSRSIVAASQTSSHPDTIPEVQVMYLQYMYLYLCNALKVHLTPKIFFA